jgi:hypothetical protein
MMLNMLCRRRTCRQLRLMFGIKRVGDNEILIEK